MVRVVEANHYAVVMFDDRRVKLPLWFPLNNRTLVFHVMRHCTVTEWVISLLRREKPRCYGTLLGLVYRRCYICPYRHLCEKALENSLEEYYERIIYEELGVN